MTSGNAAHDAIDGPSGGASHVAAPIVARSGEGADGIMEPSVSALSASGGLLLSAAVAGRQRRATASYLFGASRQPAAEEAVFERATVWRAPWVVCGVPVRS
jgi:hypothetical protein